MVRRGQLRRSRYGHGAVESVKAVPFGSRCVESG